MLTQPIARSFDLDDARMMEQRSRSATVATSASMLYRVRRQLVEEGLKAVLSGKQRETITKLIALECSKPPKAALRRRSSIKAASTT